MALGNISDPFTTDMAELGGEERGAEPVTVTVRAFATKRSTFPGNKTTSIERLRMGEYMQLENSNYPALDSFCVSKGVPWQDVGDDNVAPTLLIFQMTTANKHPTIGHALQDVIDRVHHLGVGAGAASSPGMNFDKDNHDVYLVFVVETLLQSAEPYLTANKKSKLESPSADLLAIKQVCLKIPYAS